MDKKNVFPALVLTAVVALVSACGGGGGGGGATGGGTPPPPPPASGLGQLITAPTVSPIASFVQNIPSNDHTGPYDEVFPGSANLWSLDADFTLANGFDDQFVFAEALNVGGDPFPSDQMFGDTINPSPTFYTPTLGTVDGIVVAKVSDGKSISGSLPTGLLTSVVTGTYAAFLNSTSDSRLQQTLDLTSLPTGSVVTIAWNDAVSLDPGAIPGYNPAAFPSYKVVIRKLNDPGTGTPLATLYSGPTTFTNQPHSRPYTKSGSTDTQKVVLSFEEKNSNFPGGTLLGAGPNNSQSFAIIDNVSAVDGARRQYVTNGDFETGDLTGWTTNTPAEVQNITSGLRTLPTTSLTVTRSFFTMPNKLWGRWVDLYTNTTGSAITTTLTYETDLGSLGAGIIYDPVSLGTSTTPAPHALTSWDSSATLLGFLDGTRDVGLVFGNAKADALSMTVDFLSATGAGADGDDVIDVTYTITVPAGGSVAIVNFVLMDGTDTGLTATDIGFQASEIDTASKAILSNFWTDPQYTVGMTQQQLDAIKNF